MTRLILAFVAALLVASTVSAQTVRCTSTEYGGTVTTNCANQNVMWMEPQRAHVGLDPSIIANQRPLPPPFNPFAAMAEGRAMAQDSILRQQQIAINRQQLGPCPPVLGPGEEWVPDVINPFAKNAAARRRQRADQRARAQQAVIGCPVVAEAPAASVIDTQAALIRALEAKLAAIEAK